MTSHTDLGLNQQLEGKTLPHEIPVANQKTKLKFNQFSSHLQDIKKINFGEIIEIQNLEKQSFLLGSSDQGYDVTFEGRESV